MTECGEIDRMRQEGNVTCFKVDSRHLLGGTEEIN